MYNVLKLYKIPCFHDVCYIYTYKKCIYIYVQRSVYPSSRDLSILRIDTQKKCIYICIGICLSVQRSVYPPRDMSILRIDTQKKCLDLSIDLSILRIDIKRSVYIYLFVYFETIYKKQYSDFLCNSSIITFSLHK